MTLRLIASIAACLAMAACTEIPPEPSNHARIPIGPTGRALARLQQAPNCGAVVDGLRKRSLAQMNDTLDQQLQVALQSGGNGYCWMAAAGQPENDREGASSYSTTNNQVAGVDEADFVKNDARYLYVLADNSLEIIDAWPAAQAHVLSKTAMPGSPKKLFVHQDRAVVYSSMPGSTGTGSAYPGPSNMGSSRECTYGYDCDFTGDGQPTEISVWDISNRSQPVLVRETKLGASLIAARRIGAAVHTVVAAPEVMVPGVRYWPEALNSCGNNQQSEQGIRDLFEALRQQNTELLAAAPISSWLPTVEDTRHLASGPVVEQGLLSGCPNTYVSPVGDGAAFLTTVSFDPLAQDALSLTTVVGRPGAVYSSDSALYVASRHQQVQGSPWFFDPTTNIEEASTVHKFALTSSPPSAVYQGSGVVKGRVLNQFAMDERNEVLRIATTTGHLPSPEVHSTLTTLRQGPEGLDEVGRLDRLAPAEDIRSVRFDGDKGYVVTFKKTDPLFVLDLSNPAQPRVWGELKIPGFSTYMHLLDETHLLTIGYDAEDHGSFAYFQGMLLQIFDVSDPAQPTLAHKAEIGTRGTSSEALTNHLAFNFFRERSLLALPMVVCEQSAGGGSAGEVMSFNGLMVYGVSAANGFDYRGGVSHGLPAQTQFYPGACSNWWSSASSTVKRSVFLEDFVFSIAADRIEVQNVQALGIPVASIPL